MNPQKVTKNIRFFNVFSARRTFAMGPRMAQALKNQENSMLFTTFYAKIKKTLWFCLLFCGLFGTGLVLIKRNGFDEARLFNTGRMAPLPGPSWSQTGFLQSISGRTGSGHGWLLSLSLAWLGLHLARLGSVWLAFGSARADIVPSRPTLPDPVRPPI